MISVAENALPKDGMRDAKVGADQHNNIRLFEVCVGVRRRIKTKGLLVSGYGGGHALASVAVSVNHPHAELAERAKEREFFGADLAGAEPGDSLLAAFVLNCF